MRITRNGKKSDHGTREIVCRAADRVFVNEGTGNVVIAVTGILGATYPNTTHEYDIIVPGSEFVSYIERILDDVCGKTRFERALGKAIVAFVRELLTGRGAS